MEKSISDIRKDYILHSLDERGADKDAIMQFRKWWTEAVNSKIDEVNAMTLATVNKDGWPSARIVLLKGFDENGFIFFTNYNSRKGKELEQNNKGALVFFWKELERQVRIEGPIEKTSPIESDIYYHSRPEGSRIGAWASPQSEVISNREMLEEKVKRLTENFIHNGIERPYFWGGYRLRPVAIEFWQGRPSRLHDRLRYTYQENGEWKIERLAP
ncbi:MAG: Pyridoxamine 5-phosphate oxidase [Chitinophagaceae bacterium]|nr:Pyridoxamine 5-phosphate oxidase [Chitinophagaceae bacterium]